jgi:hypothetical protein
MGDLFVAMCAGVAVVVRDSRRSWVRVVVPVAGIGVEH